MSFPVEITVRPNTHTKYLPSDSDAISCPYNMEGFTVMNAVITAHSLDHEHFQKSAKWHQISKFRAISHGSEKPFIITTTKCVPWIDRKVSPAREIMRLASIERCESLCITHFAYIEGKFPAKDFLACIRQIVEAPKLRNLRKVVIDVDSNHWDMALHLYKKIRRREQIKRRITNALKIFQCIKSSSKSTSA